MEPSADLTSLSGSDPTTLLLIAGAFLLAFFVLRRIGKMIILFAVAGFLIWLYLQSGGGMPGGGR